MKKKLIIIGTAVVAVALVAVLTCIIIINNNKKIVTTITIDINPSIELGITKNGRVGKITALSKDGEEFARADCQGKKLEDYLDEMVQRTLDLHLAETREITIILGMDGNNKKIEDAIQKAFERKDISANIIIPTISEEARKEAETHNITPAKAAYILEIIASNEALHFEDLVEISARELNEMKESGLYCDQGYNLVEGMCDGKVKEESATEGKTCPSNYEKVGDKCYKSSVIREELSCENGQTLQVDKCTGEEAVAAKVKCDSGTYNASTGVCESYTFVSEGTKYCNGDGKISQKGTCSYGKPLINGGCEGSDVVLDGMCYNMIDGGSDYALISCPSGTTGMDGSNGIACYKKSTTNPTYYCEGNAKLKDNKCSGPVTKDAIRKVVCDNGYTLVEDRVCVNYSEPTDMVFGLICPKESVLEGDKCVYYERVPAKKK